MPGHQIVQLHLIFCVVPPPRHSHNSCTNMFLAYVQPTLYYCSSAKPSVPKSERLICGVFNRDVLFEKAHHIDGSFLGDVIALEHIRALVDLIPHFGEAAEKHLSKEMVLEHVSEFRLNKYFEKQLFYALH